MSDTVSDEEVQEAREYVDTLRDKIAEEKNRASVIASDNENAVRKAALDNEAENLERELAALQAANDPATVQAQIETLTSQVDASNEPQVVDTTPPPPPPLPTDDGPAADDEN
jgi:hypothetical protein